MSILFLNHQSEFGGAERSLISLLAGIDRDEFRPRLVCSIEGPLAAAARNHGVPVHLVPMLFRNPVKKALGLWRAGAAIAELCERESVRAIHANTLIAGYCGLRAARRAGVPLVWHVRDETYPAIAKVAVRRADRVIANSRATARSLGQVANLEVVYNGIDNAFFGEPIDLRRRALRRELGLEPDTVVVATVGRIDPQKGHDVLIEAAEKMRTPVAFVIIGDVLFDASREEFGDLRVRLERDVTARGLADRFHFVGMREDVSALLAGCDVLAHPTRRYESFGRAIAEAQALGVPAVASDLGGIAEIIDDGETGFLVTPGDSSALAEALESVCADSALRARLGAASRRNAESRFRMDRHVAAVESILRDAIDSR